MNLAAAILSAVGTLAAAVAAFGAWLAARQSARATAALTRVEQGRRHAELTPQFSVSCRTTGGDRAQLRVELVGPPGLDHLDEMTVTIRDDIRGRAPVVAGGPSIDEIAQQVWGPYRFVPAVDGADATGRSIAPATLLLGDWRPFTLEETRSPHWYDSASWRREYADQPVRLTLTGRRNGDEVWTVPLEVHVDKGHATVRTPPPMIDARNDVIPPDPSG